MNAGGASHVRIPAGSVVLSGTLRVPPAPTALVVAIFGGQNDSLAAPDRFPIQFLEYRGFATLTVNLLTHREEAEESRSGWYHLDVPFLADRTCLVLAWIRRQTDLCRMPLGFLVQGTAVAGALMSASHHPEVRAVVSVNGRADLAEDALAGLQVPTLFLVDASRLHDVDLNRYAAGQLRAPHRLDIVQDSDDKIPNSGVARIVGEHAVEWLRTYVSGQAARLLPAIEDDGYSLHSRTTRSV